MSNCLNIFDARIERKLRRRQQLKKREQLGFPIGTATHRLRKLVIFELVQQVGRDCCFRCGLKIESAADIVMDHKVPWLDNSAELFWDLNNIAFSHARCNLRAVRRDETGATILRRVGPPGTAWCCRHQAFFPVRKFNRKRSHWNGYSPWCKPCEAFDRRRRAKRRVQILREQGRHTRKELLLDLFTAGQPKISFLTPYYSPQSLSSSLCSRAG